MAKVLQFNVEAQPRREKSALVEAGRKRIGLWLKEVESEIHAGNLIDGDLRFGKALCSFPSATLEGVCWAGQLRLSKSLAKSVSTVGRAVARFEGVGLLWSERRGRGRTNRYVFSIKGKPLVDRSHDRASMQDHNPASVQDHEGHDRSSVTDKSTKLPESTNRDSPPNPPPATALADTPQDSASYGVTLQGEVLGPEGEITFEEFWKALRHDEPGPTGPALAHWRKLSADDRRAIGALIGPNGLDLDRMWATTWLADRRWERQRLRSRSLMDAVDAMGDRLSGLKRTHSVILKPYSTEWNAERTRKIEAGEIVKLMDTWAREGRGWEMRVLTEPDE